MRRTKLQADVMSLPVRGAWIEIIAEPLRGVEQVRSLPVRGAWIEIGINSVDSIGKVRRSPCGERGLKFKDATGQDTAALVAPRAGSVD